MATKQIATQTKQAATNGRAIATATMQTSILKNFIPLYLI